MALATGQLPDQPTVDGAKRQLAALGAHACTRHVVEQPLQLGGGEVGVQHQPGLLLDHGRAPLRTQRITAPRSAPVLPDNRIGHRLPGLAVPQHRGLTLVGDADSVNIARLQTRFLEHIQRHRVLRAPDLAGVVLDPSGMWKVLPELLLRYSRHLTGTVKNYRARTCGALIERKNELHRPRRYQHSG